MIFNYIFNKETIHNELQKFIVRIIFYDGNALNGRARFSFYGPQGSHIIF